MAPTARAALTPRSTARAVTSAASVASTGTWTYTLTVTAVTITQTAPTTGSTSTSNSSTFTDQLAASGNIGTVTYTAGTPTAQGIITAIAQGLSTVAKNRYMGAEAIKKHAECR